MSNSRPARDPIGSAIGNWAKDPMPSGEGGWEAGRFTAETQRRREGIEFLCVSAVHASFERRTPCPAGTSAPAAGRASGGEACLPIHDVKERAGAWRTNG